MSEVARKCVQQRDRDVVLERAADVGPSMRIAGERRGCDSPPSRVAEQSAKSGAVGSQTLEKWNGFSGFLYETGTLV